MSRCRSVRTRAYDKLPPALAIKKALREAKIDFPATGETESVENAERHSHEKGGEGSGQNSEQATSCASREASKASLPAVPLLNLGHVFREVERRSGV